ncbi:MAG: polysaccharide biosynthesis tyrosine autokinase [Propionibacteriales bacterium]|nr:polysaccharide biosynthesis tyrosine autokinase [Propionibacteriales bacterium]
MLRGRWLLIVLMGLLGTSIALIISAVQAPKYTASADVFVTVTSGQSTGDLAQGSTFSQDQARNFAAVVTKEIVLGPVIKQFGLTITLDDMRKNVEVDVPLNTSVISIKVTDRDPAKAAALANAVANQLSSAVASLTPTVNDVKGAPVRAELIEAAGVPNKPSSPIVPLYAVLGLLAGLVLAIAYLVVVELVVARVDSSEQVEALTGSVVLASVPRDRRVSRHPIAVTALPLSLRAEAIRHVRTALKFLPGEVNQTFVITSSVSGEGKSTTAANIAAAFAAEGLSTCLVEADLRRPRLEGLLDLTGGPGLSDIVVGQCQIEDTVQSWGPDDLQVILVGTIPPNASELLGSSRGQEALRMIASRFDITIIDTPPLTAVTDAAIIGRMFDGVVMVVGGGKVRTSELRQSMGALAVADVPIRGTVLNLAKEDASRPYAYAYSDRNRQTRLADLLPQGWRPVIKAAAAIVATVAVALTAVGLTNAQETKPGSISTPQISAPASAPATPATPKAVFIGDSMVSGVGGGGTKWTTLVSSGMGWSEVNLGRGGTGYVTSSDAKGCGLSYCPTFAEMADAAIAEKPDVVVISGGVNDGTNSVSTAANALFANLKKGLPNAQIIVLSPLGQATVYPDALKQAAAEVKAAAQANGVRYVAVGNPLEGHPEWFTADGLTPNADGYKKLAAAILSAIKKG